MAYIKTPVNGSETFPVNENDVYKLIETIAVQEIGNIKSANRLYDALYYYDLTGTSSDAAGTVIEQAVINKATEQTYNKMQCDKSPVDPTVAVRYYNNWDMHKYTATARRDDIRRIIANKGTGVEDVVASIIDTLTQGNDSRDFKESRKLIMETTVTDYSSTLGGAPANMDGVLYAIRDMYESLRDENTAFTTTGWETATPEADIRIAVSSKLLNLLDVTKLANVLNLNKAELFGKIVVVPISDEDKTKWFKVVVYDRKAFNRARRVYDMDNEPCVGSRYHNYYLFVEDAFFYSPLFKATSLDVSVAANAELARIITLTPASK